MSQRPLGLIACRFLGLWGGSQTVTTLKENNQTDEKQNGGLLATNTSIDFLEAEANSEDEVNRILLKEGVPGLVVGVSKRGQLLWSQAFGYCDVENLVPCEIDSVMRIGSVSKSLFAATVVAPLIEQKKVSLEDSIHKYLDESEFPRKTFNAFEYDITIKQLLSHTAGIPSYKTTRFDQYKLAPIHSKGDKIYKCDEMVNNTGFFDRKHYKDVFEALEAFKDEPLACEPGKFTYTTYGYTLLSAVMQKVIQEDCKDDKDKKQIEDLWIEKLRNDWKMNNTRLDIDDYIIPRRARYYMRAGFNGSLVNAQYQNSSVKWAGGGLLSTTGDMLKFGQMLVDSYHGRPAAPLKRETVDLLWTKVAGSYGLGFSLRKTDDDMLIAYHTGNSVGSSSVLLIIPEQEIVVAVIGNLIYQNFMPLARSIAQEFARAGEL